MKKLLALVLSLIMVLALVPATFAADADFTLMISGGNTCNSLVEQDGKELLRVDVQLDGGELVSIYFTLMYDTNQLTLKSYTMADLNGYVNDTTAGEFGFGFMSAEPINMGRMPLVTLFFEINENVALGSEIAFTLKNDPNTDVGVVDDAGHTVSANLGADFTAFTHTAHTPAAAVRENETNPTCTEKGGYDEVVYCSFCHKELSRTHTDIPANGHTPGEAVRENEVEATCEAAGGYDTVVYCTVCEAEISRVHTDVPAKGHAWGEPTYTWEGTSVTAKAVCGNDATHELTETVEAVFALTAKPVVGEACTAAYIATFENELFETQTKDAAATGWQTYEENGYYLDAESKPVTGWQKIDGVWFYFEETDGTLKTGWLLDSGNWYYLEPAGEDGIEFGVTGAIYTNGWRKVDGQWYYFFPGGHIARNTWKQIPDGSGIWYYFTDGGQMVTGWHKINGLWYYFNPGGSLVTGWRKINDNWYYFGTGAMRTGWQKIDGKWYYFKKLPDQPEGAMVTGEYVIDGTTYNFDENGVWIP